MVLCAKKLVEVEMVRSAVGVTRLSASLALRVVQGLARPEGIVSWILTVG